MDEKKDRRGIEETHRVGGRGGEDREFSNLSPLVVAPFRPRYVINNRPPHLYKFEHITTCHRDIHGNTRGIYEAKVKSVREKVVVA